MATTVALVNPKTKKVLHVSCKFDRDDITGVSGRISSDDLMQAVKILDCKLDKVCVGVKRHPLYRITSREYAFSTNVRSMAQAVPV